MISKDANQNDEFVGIEYDHIFDPNISLHYQTTYTGYKELIEIKTPTAKNTFSFVLRCSGLLPVVSESGEIELIEKSSGQQIGCFAQLYVYDSSNNPLYTLNNSYTVEPISIDDGLYLVSLDIDSDFLRDNNTQYPVIIDPTFTYKIASAIDDAPVYSGIPNSAQGSNYYNHIGYVNSTYKKGSLLVKFPALKRSSMFNGLSDSRINSVTYNVMKVGGNSSYSATLGAYRYTGSSWDEDTVTYNSAAIDSHTGSLVSSISLQSNTWYSFNITSVAKAWKNGTASYDSGLVVKNTTNNSNSAYDRSLASIEYAQNVNSTYMPYITIIFNNGSGSAAFDSADLAAKHFSECVYSSCEYVRIEYAATIYSIAGKYYYYNVHCGEPHSVTVSNSVPSGATYVAYIHTHPNSEYFSDADKAIAGSLGGNAYIATPSYTLKRYNPYNDNTAIVYVHMSIFGLTDSEKTNLVSDLGSTWYGHFVSGVCPDGFGCENKTWPNE